MNNTTKRDYTFAPAYAIYADETNYWFVTSFNVFLYKLEKITGIVSIVCELDHEGFDFQFSDIFYYEGKLYITPRCCKCINVYDIDNDKLDSYKIIEGSVNHSFFNSVINVDHILYLIPYRYSKVGVWNMENDMYSEIEVPCDKILEDELSVCWGNACFLENYLYIPIKSQKNVMKIDICNRKVEIVQPCGQSKDYLGSLAVEKNIWLISADASSIIVWNPETDTKVNTIELTNSGLTFNPYLKNKVSAFSKMARTDDKVVIIACSANENLIVDVNTFEVSLWTMEFDDKWDDTSFKFVHRNSTLFLDDNKMILINGITGEWYSLDNMYFILQKKKSNFYFDDGKTLLFTEDDLLYFLQRLHL